MCTAISDKNLFGRTLDVEEDYGQQIVLSPRNYKKIGNKYAIFGVALIAGDYPLYFDGTNEKGLSAAGLNYPGNAFYNVKKEGKVNLAPFEFLPYILGNFESVEEVKKESEKINITDTHFSDELKNTPMHWIVSDEKDSITIEPTREGLKIYDNPVGVLTNNPPFDIQLFGLSRYMGLSAKAPENTFSYKINLNIYSRGMGAIGLPGDLSSPSRFVRAVFAKYNIIYEKGEEITRFFHILGSVCQQKGCVITETGEYEYTLYENCYDRKSLKLYYKTYYGREINQVHFKRENFDGEKLISYEMKK